jgi:hypothetical protein
MINGKAGAFSGHAPENVIEGFIGEPFVVRVLNAGLQTASLHTHANHFFLIAVNNVVLEDMRLPDTVTVRTLEGDEKDVTGGGALSAGDALFFAGGSRMDWLFPMVAPPDIPGRDTAPLRDLIPNEFRFVLGGVPQSPLKYPMHDHMEPSQTAIGGNYPQGTMSDIIFLGDVDKVPFPKPA